MCASDVAFCAISARASGAHRPSSLTKLAERAGRVRCPFWRRRATDALEVVSGVLAWAAARHASLPSVERKPHEYCGPCLCMTERVKRIRDDFEERQYYVTGKLSKELYAQDCVFDGPDPDTPVRGVRKWAQATAGLFDQSVSRVDLTRIAVVGDYEVRADWRLEGVLNLPWKPPIKPYTGSTIYKFNQRGLIYEHLEEWSISALDAFVSVVWPSFGAPPAPPLSATRKAPCPIELLE